MNVAPIYRTRPLGDTPLKWLGTKIQFGQTYEKISGGGCCIGKWVCRVVKCSLQLPMDRFLDLLYQIEEMTQEMLMPPRFVLFFALNYLVKIARH